MKQEVTPPANILPDEALSYFSFHIPKSFQPPHRRNPLLNEFQRKVEGEITVGKQVVVRAGDGEIGFYGEAVGVFGGHRMG